MGTLKRPFSKSAAEGNLAKQPPWVNLHSQVSVQCASQNECHYLRKLIELKAELKKVKRINRDLKERK